MAALQPPPAFDDFAFAFDPSLLNLFPNPMPLPSSADLFLPVETNYLHGFLDNFSTDDFPNWDFSYPEQQMEQQQPIEHLPSPIAPYSNPHLNTSPEASTSGKPRRSSRAASSRGQDISPPIQFHSPPPDPVELKRVKSNSAERSPVETPSTSASGRSKPLLSTPQKRLNHIMSEQKRRNAIRDGYAQLISLLAPAGSEHGLDMPTRGRPKGSGNRGKGQTKGKSGVLFRAVEYCKWLEEGRDALQDEVDQVETALAGLRP